VRIDPLPCHEKPGRTNNGIGADCGKESWGLSHTISVSVPSFFQLPTILAAMIDGIDGSYSASSQVLTLSPRCMSKYLA
jgi:hypothetical protein